MSKRYKKNQSFQKYLNRGKDTKIGKITEKENNIRTKNLKRRLRLTKRHRGIKHREEKRREEKRREEKRREEKRREEKRKLIPGEARGKQMWFMIKMAFMKIIINQ